MSETNGSGRLDRVETALDRIEAAQTRDHEEFTRDHKQMMIWQVLMQDKMEKFSEDRDRERKRLDQLWENTDKRIADLVTTIGKLIER
jgi:hypothetical protein